ncbi:hypothetical protein CTI14_44620 [Methylobacterium radiotolerans]|nr:hypothetical protein CTI14_44620 [Methylobacterium radiotolerans]
MPLSRPNWEQKPRRQFFCSGESGTGKELFAHAIHNASDRKYRQCGADHRNREIERQRWGHP